jgi:hypothetical protein
MREETPKKLMFFRRGCNDIRSKDLEEVSNSTKYN